MFLIFHFSFALVEVFESILGYLLAVEVCLVLPFYCSIDQSCFNLCSRTVVVRLRHGSVPGCISFGIALLCFTVLRETELALSFPLLVVLTLACIFLLVDIYKLGIFFGPVIEVFFEAEVVFAIVNALFCHQVQIGVFIPVYCFIFLDFTLGQADTIVYLLSLARLLLLFFYPLEVLYLFCSHLARRVRLFLYLKLMLIVFIIIVDFPLGILHGHDILLVFDPNERLLKTSSILLDFLLLLKLLLLPLHVLRICFEINRVVIIQLLDKVFILLAIKYNVVLFEDVKSLCLELVRDGVCCAFLVHSQDVFNAGLLEEFLVEVSFDDQTSELSFLQ